MIIENIVGKSKFKDSISINFDTEPNETTCIQKYWYLFIIVRYTTKCNNVNNVHFLAFIRVKASWDVTSSIPSMLTHTVLINIKDSISLKLRSYVLTQLARTFYSDLYLIELLFKEFLFCSSPFFVEYYNASKTCNDRSESPINQSIISRTM